MAQQQPKPPVPPEQQRRAWAWKFLYTAFAISLLFHAVAAPLLTQFFKMQPEHQQETISKVTVEKAVVKPPPTPKPTPPPTPPPPKQTPPPSTPQPVKPQPKQQVKVQVQHLENNTQGASGGQAVNASSKGAEAPPAVGPAPSAPPAPAPTAPPPTAPPTPACAVPNKDPQPTNRVPADYPEMAKEQGASGETDVAVTLDATGHVIATKIAKSAGNPLLDQAALQAAKSSSFSPQIENCRAVGGVYIFQVVFSPDNG